MEANHFDVIVVGAGAAGLMGAWELALTGKNTIVVEARDRVGGRIHTISDAAFQMPVELGAEFIHGKLPLTQSLLEKANAKSYKIVGSFWQNEDGALHEQQDFIEDFDALNAQLKKPDNDLSVADFIGKYLQEVRFEEARFTLKNYVEGYYAANANRASTFALKEDLNKSDDVQFRIEGGYEVLIKFLHEQCTKAGVRFLLSHPVTEIHWNPDEVQVHSNHESFIARKILITVPMGVLQSESIVFSPAIDEKLAAAKQLGYGNVIKTILQFDEPFWKNERFTSGKNLDDMNFVFSRSMIPTWWTQYPKAEAILTGWSGGPHADELLNLADREIVETALESLSHIFNIETPLLQQKLIAWRVANWATDPYSCGAYSYDVVNGSELKKMIRQPEANTLFFAGEALIDGPQIGTVEAALSSGWETAHSLVASF